MLRENIDYYKENEKYVLTSLFLFNRGYCCDSGCRHCPYKTGMTKQQTLDQVLDLLKSAGDQDQLNEIFKNDTAS